LPFIIICQNFTELGRVGIWWAMVYSNFMIVVLGRFLFSKVDFSATISRGKAASAESK